MIIQVVIVLPTNFQVAVDRPASVNDIKVSGPGINPKYCRANTPITFKVDATKSAKGNIDVKMVTDKGKITQIVLFINFKLFLYNYLFETVLGITIVNIHTEKNILVIVYRI